MSDDEDVPQEALYFSRRAAFVPKVSAEEFESMSKFLNENKRKLPEKEKKRPPPTKRGKTGSAAKKYTPEPEAILIEAEKELVPPSPEVVLSPAVKRRLKKSQDQRASEMKWIEAANQEVLLAADSDSDSLNEIEEVNTNSSENNVHAILTISFMSEISRLRCLEHEKFSTIFPRVASLFNLKASEILLCLKEKNINVDDTPKSLNITLNDTIECIPYIPGKNANEDDEDTLKIIFQSNDSKEKIDLLVHKLEKMQDVMARYSEKRSIPLDKFSFEFDGEKIMGTETPEDLDMESGNCIDVKVVTSSPKRSPRRRPPAPVITVDDDSTTDCEISNCSASSDIVVLSVTPGYMGVASNVTVTTDATRSPRTRGRGRGRSRGRGRGRSRGASRRNRGVLDLCVIN